MTLSRDSAMVGRGARRAHRSCDGTGGSTSDALRGSHRTTPSTARDRRSTCVVGKARARLKSTPAAFPAHLRLYGAFRANATRLGPKDSILPQGRLFVSCGTLDGITLNRSANGHCTLSSPRDPLSVDQAYRSLSFRQYYERSIDDPIVAAMARAIVEKWDPLKIILFGSRARGNMREDSDVDFLVVVPLSLKSRETTAAILPSLANVEPRYAVDIVLTTPEELEEYGHICGLVYFYALEEGKTIYAQPL